MSLMNRLGNSANRFQGDAKRVLTICSAGLLRSPTAAVVLAMEPYNYNTRAVGIVEDFALIPVDEVLASWADEVVCMEPHHAQSFHSRCEEWNIKAPPRVLILDIPDNFMRMDDELVRLIKERYDEVSKKQSI